MEGDRSLRNRLRQGQAQKGLWRNVLMDQPRDVPEPEAGIIVRGADEGTATPVYRFQGCRSGVDVGRRSRAFTPRRGGGPDTTYSEQAMQMGSL